MAYASSRTTDNPITRIIQSNNTVQQSTCSLVTEFRDVQKRFVRDVASTYTRLGTMKDVINIFLPEDKVAILDQFKPFGKLQMVVCGHSSSGKTSFIHELLQCGTFLPMDTANVTSRIVQFSYASADQACLVVHRAGVSSPLVSDRVDLSKFFSNTNSARRDYSKELRDTIEQHLVLPNDIQISIAPDTWASQLVEICLPSPFLQLGIEVYDTPGLNITDSPILVQNLQALIEARHPCLLFLYDNATISDDTRNCYERLKVSLRNVPDIGIFFLNTKANVIPMLHDNAIYRDEPDDFLEYERTRRYELLKNVSPMGNGLPRTLAECDCFDVITIEPYEHELITIMKKNTIDRIVRFAADHTFRSTRQVSSIMLDAIDAFFDFVLITNRRSLDEWDILRDEALRWTDDFFQQYRLQIDAIGDEAQREILVQFRKNRNYVVKKVLAYKMKRNGEFYHVSSGLTLINALEPIETFDERQFIESTVHEEIIKPILNKIIDQISGRVSERIDQLVSARHPTRRNELIRAAYREFLNSTGNINYKRRRDYSSKEVFKHVLLGISEFMNVVSTAVSFILSAPDESFKYDSEKGINRYLDSIEQNLINDRECIKKNLRGELETSQKNFEGKVHAYHKVVLETMRHRHRAHVLARSFAGHFARIECQLVANLDLVRHQGIPPTIEHHVVLGHGGFFSVHPVSWGSDHTLVGKVLLDTIKEHEVAYLEAHFHRTITRLRIEHMVPLHFLYQGGHGSKLCIILPRYPTNLHAYLNDHMDDISIDISVRIVCDISRAVAHMHAHDLVHRDIKVQNILLDDDKNVFLADFGTCQHGTENTTIIGSRPFAPEVIKFGRESTYEGTAVDVFALGILMYVVAPKRVFYQPLNPITLTHINDLLDVPESYRELIRQCVINDPKARPAAAKVVEQLEAIADQVANVKSCLMCLDRPIFRRCLPCGHKTVCGTCLGLLQGRATARQPPECILCRQVFTSTEEDADDHTFMTARSAP